MASKAISSFNSLGTLKSIRAPGMSRFGSDPKIFHKEDVLRCPLYFQDCCDYSLYSHIRAAVGKEAPSYYSF